MAVYWDATTRVTECENCHEPFEASYDDQVMCPACVNADLPDDEPEVEVYEKGDQSAFDAYFEKAKREGDNFGELLKVLRRVK